MSSKFGALGSSDVKKILKGAVIAGGGATLFFTLDALVQYDWGTWQPLVVAGFGILANVVRKVISDGAEAPGGK